MDITCDRCGKLLAKDDGDAIEIINGRKKVRIEEAALVEIDCARCGKTKRLQGKPVMK